MPLSSLLLGFSAGAVSALLFASAATGTLIGVLVLFLLSPLPVAITGLGWGWPAAGVAALSAAAWLWVLGTLSAALMHLMAIGLPTMFLSFLLLLRRDTVSPLGGQGVTQWYPIGRVLGYAALWAGVLAFFSLQTLGGDYDAVRSSLRQTAERFIEIAGQRAQAEAGESEIQAWAEVMTLSFAASMGMTWMLLSALNLWLAGRVTRASGRLARPWPDLGLIRIAALTVQALALTVAIGVGLSIAGQKYLALVASGFSAALLFACMLVGLAIIHYHSRGWALRPMALGATYAGLLFVPPWSYFATAMLAIVEPVLPLQRPPEDTPPARPVGEPPTS